MMTLSDNDHPMHEMIHTDSESSTEVTENRVPSGKQENQEPDHQAELPMKWYKFLIYFGLWYSAYQNVISALEFFTGKLYEDVPNIELVFQVFPSWRFVDYLCGVALLVIACLCIVARNRLAKLEKNGPASLYRVYWGEILLYVLHSTALAGMMQNRTLLLMGLIEVVGDGLMLYFSRTYFKKRAFMFIH